MSRENQTVPDDAPGGTYDPDGEAKPAPVQAWTSIDEGAVIPAAVIGTCRVPGIVIYEGTSIATNDNYVVAAPVSPSQAQTIDKASDWMRVGGYRSIVLAFTLGPVQAFVNLWRGNEKFGPVLVEKLGVYRAMKVPRVGWVHTLDATTTLHLGASAPVWSPPAYDPPALGQAWEGIAQLRSDKLALTSEAETPTISAELRGLGVEATGEKDASARDAVYALLTSHEFGFGLSDAQIQIDTGIDGTADSSFSRWCEVNDFRVSGVVAGQTRKDALEALAVCCFSTVLYSEGKVKLIPLGSEVLSGNGYTYTPPTPVVLDASDWQRLEVDQVPDDEVFNTWTVKYADRDTNGLYEERIVEYQDAAHAATYGVRRAEEVSAPWIKKRSRAHRLAQFRCKESLYQRTRVRFDLPRHYGLLEPGDLISADLFGVTRTLRIRSFDQPRDGWCPVEAVEVPTGSSTPIDLTPGSAAMQPGISWGAGAAAADKADTDLGNITATLGGGNLLRNSTFEAGVDADGGGATRGWGRYDNAPVGGTIAQVASGGHDGGAFCRVAWTSGTQTQIGIYTRAESGHAVAGRAAGVPWQTERWYTVTGYAKASVLGTAQVTLRWNRPPSSTIVVESPVLTSAWQRFTFRVRWDAGQPIWNELFLDGNGAGLIGAGAGSVDFDSVQVEEGDVATAFAPRTDEILPGTVGQSEIAADAISTSNYAEDGSGNPTAGARMAVGTTAPIKAGPLGIQVGTQTLGEPVVRALTSLALNGSGSAQRGWYRGSNEGVQPYVSNVDGSVTQLTITRRRWDTTRLHGRFDIDVQPSGTMTTDNYDGLRYVRVHMYGQGVAGTGNQGGVGAPVLIGTKYLTIPDRRYEHATDSNAANAIHLTLDIFGGDFPTIQGSARNYPAFVVQLVGVAGSSPGRCYYTPSSPADGQALGCSGDNWPSGWGFSVTPPSGGSGNAGGTCVAPEARILLASGRHVAAADLEVGALVWAKHEVTGRWGAYPVSRVSVHLVPARLRAVLDSGATLTTSPPHRVAGERDWREVRELTAGELVESTAGFDRVVRVEDGGPGPVVLITVDDAHTYVANGILSHNAKILA